MSDSNIVNILERTARTAETEEEFADLPIPCIDCSQNFIWTAGEQAFFREKDLVNPPKRCKDCKRAKNRRIEAIELSHTTGKPHKIEVEAKCAKCEQVTTVPFYPSQGRPVYCRDCFLTLKSKVVVNGSNASI
ncbi:MAG: zinc-ribbon domain containing protein [Pyrinomonadaceae bacterium]